jgi:glyoxylase-like metal-dependent hydrolase (beta-lactamase superfamily II)
MARVVRLGTWAVNWYLVEDEGRVTIVDGGLPKYIDQFEPGLASLGRSGADVAAIVLTHAHSDHVGTTERLRTQLGVPVYVHEADAELARTARQTGKTERSILPYLRHAMPWRGIVHLVANGVMKQDPIGEVQTFADGAVLDVPGRLRVIHTPGHVPGHCALVSDAADAVFAGDALCTLNGLTGKRGPQLMAAAMNRDSAQALASLDRLDGTGVTTLYVGHGEPVVGGVDAAIAEAKRRGLT